MGIFATFPGWAVRLLVMASVTRFTTFEDAFYFYAQAKGLPVVTSSQPLVERYCRVSILLSWVALEEVIRSAAVVLDKMERVSGPFPSRLYEKLSYLLAGLQQPGIPQVDFMSQRQLRNNIAHANQSNQPMMTPDDALATFKFCFEAAQAIWPHKIAGT